MKRLLLILVFLTVIDSCFGFAVFSAPIISHRQLRSAVYRLTKASSVYPKHTSCFIRSAGKSDYDASSITVLEGLEPVRKRPGMYIGSTGESGLHHLIFEIVDNSVDEALAGHCTDINVTLHDDGSVEICDNGRGIPCSIHPTTGKSSLETVLCVLHAGGKFGGSVSGYKVSGGLHGVGSSVVNALSEELSVTVKRDDQVYAMKFSRGKVVQPMSISAATSATGDVVALDPSMPKSTGTSIRFKPDPLIFKTSVEFDIDKLAKRLDEIAYLNAGLRITLNDCRKSSYYGTLPKAVRIESNDEISEDEDTMTTDVGAEQKKDTSTTTAKKVKLKRKQHFPLSEQFVHSGGISELLSTLIANKGEIVHTLTNNNSNSNKTNNNIISITGTKDGVSVEVACCWLKDSYGSEVMSSFVNSIPTNDGGSHVDGLKSSIVRNINNMAKKVKLPLCCVSLVLFDGDLANGRLARIKKVM